MNDTIIRSKKVNKLLIILNVVVAFFYFLWWVRISNIGNPILYSLLFLGEIYHILLALAFWFTVRPINKNENIPQKLTSNFWVDIFITVVSEPVEVVEQTVNAAKNIDYPNKRIFILNDGFVARYSKWMEIENLAQKLKVNCITRKIGGGAKAGNINHALKRTSGEIIVLFDADMVPQENFLQETLPFFADKKMGFVQTPQFYKNYYLNQVTSGAWEQQELFFGPIMQGKNNSNAAFICGTNVAIRRQALEQVGGMREDNIAEDFLTSLSIHQAGWKSEYLKEVLAQGLAPQDLSSYYSQQLRWARGSLEVAFKQNPIFKKGLSLPQKIEYLSSALYYLSGLVVLIDAIMPLMFLFFGIQPVKASTTNFALLFLPFIFLSMYTIYLVSDGSFSFKALSFSFSSFEIQLRALFSVLMGKKLGFVVTSKKQLEGNFLPLIYPHLAYILLSILGAIVAITRQGFSPAVATNISWAIFNILLTIPFLQSAYDFKKLFSLDLSAKSLKQHV